MTPCPLPSLPSDCNFLGLERPFCDFHRARFVVLPVAYEKTTSYRKGTRHGPAKLLEASRQVEFFDEEIKEETARKHGIATVPVIKPASGIKPEVFFSGVSCSIRELIRAKKFTATVGGEHTITYAAVNAFKDFYPDLSILYVDAHSDLRDSYEGTPWNHACALRRSIEAANGVRSSFVIPAKAGIQTEDLTPLARRGGVRGNPKVALVGVRNIDKEEADYLRQNPNCALFDAEQCRRMDKIIPKIIKHLSRHVYITIDLDGLDPSVVPGVGTPQPGGLGWYDLLDLLREVFNKRKVIGVDLMELAPIKGQVVSEFAAAKLLYRIFSYASR